MQEMVKSNYLTKHWNASKYFHPESGAAVEKFPFSHWKHVTEIVRLPKGTTTELAPLVMKMGPRGSTEPLWLIHAGMMEVYDITHNYNQLPAPPVAPQFQR